jgi:hypothetical protein
MKVVGFRKSQCWILYPLPQLCLIPGFTQLSSDFSIPLPLATYALTNKLCYPSEVPQQAPVLPFSKITLYL